MVTKKNIWYIADLHWDHRRIIDLSDRPFHDLNHMQHTIIDNWNKVVNDRDDVYVLGDTCFRVDMLLKLLGKLNGHIHLLRGNHDYDAVSKLDKEYKFDNIIIHQQDIVIIKDGNRGVVLCHYPIFEWIKWYNGYYHIFAHIHGNINGNENKSRSFRLRAYDAGVDVNNYTPTTLDEFINRKLTCSECMHFSVCKYSDEINRHQCTYLK